MRGSHYKEVEYREVYERVFGQPIPAYQLPAGQKGEKPKALPLWRGDVRPLYFPPTPVSLEAACQWLEFQLAELSILAEHSWLETDANDEVHDGCVLAYHLRTKGGRKIEIPWKYGQHFSLEEGLSLLADALDNLKGVGAPVAFLGENRIRVGTRILTLEYAEGQAVEALVKKKSGLVTELAKLSQVDEFHRVIRRVVKKFPELGEHIRMPERHGAGGYSTTMTDETESGQSAPQSPL